MECRICKQEKKLHAKLACYGCYMHERIKNDPHAFLTDKYIQITRRLREIDPSDNGRYENLEVCTKKQFIKRFIKSTPFLRLFKQWIESGHKLDLCPSVDRIDGKRGYTLDNIHFITFKENREKDVYRKAWVAAYTKKGEYVGKFRNRHIAAEYLGIPQIKIWMCLINKIKSTYGYTFKWTTPLIIENKGT